MMLTHENFSLENLSYELITKTNFSLWNDAIQYARKLLS